jgi:hypothetical protein
LREHLKRLPDFDDIGEESRALDYVESHEDFLRALWFLASWPALDRAAKLVEQRGARNRGRETLLFAAPSIDLTRQCWIFTHTPWKRMTPWASEYHCRLTG